MSQTNENTESTVTPEVLLGKINESTEALQDAQQTVVDAVGKVTNAIDEHNVDVEAHPNIRGNIDEITETAQTAQTAASEANEKADNALAAANAVNDIATAAQTAASEASDKATAAQTTATAAQTAASEANDKATAAQTTATAAQTMADSALEKAEEALAKPGGGDVSEIVERVEALENTVGGKLISTLPTNADEIKELTRNLEDGAIVMAEDEISDIDIMAPVGAVIAYATNSAPTGFLLCNGAAVSRTTYAELFAAIGTTYGAGDDSTTFNLPNLTDRFIQGSDTAGTVKNAGLPNITGFMIDVFYGSAGGCFTSQRRDNGSVVVGANASGAVSVQSNFGASNSSPIYGASSTVQPPALTMRYYIKY